MFRKCVAIQPIIFAERFKYSLLPEYTVCDKFGKHACNLQEALQSHKTEKKLGGESEQGERISSGVASPTT